MGVTSEKKAEGMGKTAPDNGHDSREHVCVWGGGGGQGLGRREKGVGVNCTCKKTACQGHHIMSTYRRQLRPSAFSRLAQEGERQVRKVLQLSYPQSGRSSSSLEEEQKGGYQAQRSLW